MKYTKCILKLDEAPLVTDLPCANSPTLIHPFTTNLALEPIIGFLTIC